MTLTPKYRIVINDLKRRIDDGELKPNEQIPSTAELCQQYKCSSTVINTAVLLLAADGYIYGQPGMGRYVSAEE